MEEKELLDECWEMIYNRLDHESYRESFTLVCKRFLSIANSLKISIKFSDDTPISILCRLLQRFPNLKKIQFSTFHGASDEAAVAISQSGLDLEELVAVSYCPRAVWLEDLSSNMKNLRVLKFTGAIGDAGLVRVADLFPQLEHIENLSCFLQNLTSITFCSCSNLSDSAFVIITQRFPRLCHFVMTGSSLGREEYDHDDGLMNKNQAIKYLDLSSHRDFIPGFPTNLTRLLKICPGVEQLKLRYCNFQPDDQLNVPDILECNRSLVELDLTGSCHITVKDMELEFELVLSVLENLNLDYTKINDTFLTKVGRICPRLIHLDLEDCSEVTEEGLKEVVKSCTRLIYLSISCCKNVDINIIPWIVANRSSLRKLVSSSSDYPDNENQELFLQQGCLVLQDPNYNFDEFLCNML